MSKNDFLRIIKKVNREGMSDLLAFLENSDFFTAPASSRYHNCHEGGLVEHSVNVFTCLYDKYKNNETWKPVLAEIDEESIIIVSLLHDICKTYNYVVEFKNKKIYSSTGSKKDGNGRFDWETVPGYTTEDKIPYGHGEKSVMMIEEFIKLKPVERYAIRWHMGFTEPKENWNTLGTAIRKYPLILALHESDQEATYLLEKEE